MNRKLLTALLLSMILGACANQPGTPTGTADATTAAPKSAENVDANFPLVVQALALIKAKNPAQALPLAERAIAQYEKQYRRDGTLSYSARFPAESFLYALEGYKENMPAKVQGPGWSLAYFTKGFALVDLNRNGEARDAFDAAIKLSPRNSQYLSERANIDALERNMRASLAGFKDALAAAELSPPESKMLDTTRALRGMAYAQVELGDLGAAKALHERVLDLDPGNTKSKNELQYIQGLTNRSARVGVPSVAAPSPNLSILALNKRFTPEAQADALIALWRETCLKHYRDPLALRDAMKATTYRENPPNGDRYLHGKPGVVWDASTSVYSQRILVLRDNGECEVRAPKTSAQRVDAVFSQSVASLVNADVTVRKLSKEDLPDDGGPLRKTVYLVESKEDHRTWQFGVGITDDAQTSSLALILIIPQGARSNIRLSTFPEKR